jgi:acyl carrier protein
MYDIDETVEQVRSTIAEHMYVSLESGAHSAALTTDLGIGSLDVIEISIALESLFDIEIEVDRAREFRTCSDHVAAGERP